jgi:hypothetical protein
MITPGLKVGHAECRHLASFLFLGDGACEKAQGRKTIPVSLSHVEFSPLLKPYFQFLDVSLRKREAVAPWFVAVGFHGQEEWLIGEQAL